MITTLPNILTLSRICVIPALIGAFYLEFPYSNWIALAIFSAASITDYFDGYIARSRGQVSGLGRFLDPVADKLLVAATLLMLVHVEAISGGAILPTIIIMCREILVSALREYLAELRVGMPVSSLAKWKTVSQLLALGFLIAGEASTPLIPSPEIGVGLLWLAACLTLYTGYDYMRLGLRHIAQDDRYDKNA